MTSPLEPPLVSCSAISVSSGTAETTMEVDAPKLFPEELWPLVDPTQKLLVAARFNMYTEDRLRELIDTLHFRLPSHSSRGEEREGTGRHVHPECKCHNVTKQDTISSGSQPVELIVDDCESDIQEVQNCLKKIFKDCFGEEIYRDAQKKVRRVFSGKRVLRNRKEAIDYNEEKHERVTSLDEETGEQLKSTQ